MTFVAAPPAEPPAAIDDAIAGDGWYPALSIGAFRSKMRIPITVEDNRAYEALLGAFISVSVSLSTWRACQEALDFEGLAATTDVEIGGENRNLILWRRAVHSVAAADLVETHGEITATDEGRRRNEEYACSAPDLRRDATAAIRALQGKGPTRMKLV